MEKLKISINRNVTGTVCFCDVFSGFEKVEAVVNIFHGSTKRVLQNLKVKVNDMNWGYMWLDDKTGELNISSRYLRGGRETSIYLDVIHELVHLKQLREGKDILDRRYGYLSRPTEIEAYRTSVDEAKRLGMHRDEILRYLRVPMIKKGEILLLARRIGL